MSRSAYALGLLPMLALAGGIHHRQPRPEPIDTSKTARIASQIPCDGSTDPEQQLVLRTTFGSGSWARAFHLDVFHEESCKVDVRFRCLVPDHEGWRSRWVADSSQPAGTGTYSLHSCYAWGTSELPHYELSGWYKEEPDNPKVPWKQAAIKQVSAKPEVYEFADPNGGAARLEIERR